METLCSFFAQIAQRIEEVASSTSQSKTPQSKLATLIENRYLHRKWKKKRRVESLDATKSSSSQQMSSEHVCFCNLRHFTSHVSVCGSDASTKVHLTGGWFANLTGLLVSGHGFHVHVTNKRDVFVL